LRELAGRNFRHSLVKLLHGAESRGLTVIVPLDSKHVEEIHRADRYYSEKVFEYPAISKAVEGYPGLPDLVVLRSVAELLVAHIETLCLDAS
jgi:hypothetical protein